MAAKNARRRSKRAADKAYWTATGEVVRASQLEFQRLLDTTADTPSALGLNVFARLALTDALSRVLVSLIDLIDLSPTPPTSPTSTPTRSRKKPTAGRSQKKATTRRSGREG
jgi:hypothetical protein